MDLGITVTDTDTEVFLNLEYLDEVFRSVQILSGSAVGRDCIMYIHGSFTAPDADILGFCWGQMVSDPYATTVYEGSYLSATEIN